jgi:hypothetical protein
MSPENLKIEQSVYWDDPDDAICSGTVIVKEIKGDIIIVARPGEQDTFEVLAKELEPLPQPNEVWRTQSGNYALIVEHVMTEVEGTRGFIWYDSVDNSLNFHPVQDQLVEKTDLTVMEWGNMMAELTGDSSS